jgi:uncharacterized membrane protein SpoIIM required for sporulation/ABC-type transport system involved in multi-copper enzyme maturation permease subunit
MSFSHIRTITRREVTDTLTDWRILLPIFILTFVLPQVLIAATGYAVEFVGDEGTVVRLVPFAMLLVGFIPASFSLITALESFVGERERNSLESLLSMPIGDSALYLGKFFSSLLPPLMSSCLAMCFFGVTLRLNEPELFVRGLSLESFALVVLLIVAKAFVMVAGAVIISSHTTSIRAANLLASFVLLPTAAVIQLEALLIIARRYDMLWLIVAGLSVMALALVRTGLGSFNREEILSREHEQLNLRRLAGTFGLFLREYQPAGVAPDHYSGGRFSLWRFYRRELPALLGEYRLPLGVALVAALAGALAGGQFAALFEQIGTSPKNVGVTPEPNLALGLLTGALNALRMLMSVALSTLSFGLFAVLVPFFAFAGVGYVAGSLGGAGGSWTALGPGSPLQFILGYVLPHGLVELPAALLGCAFGVRIGASIMVPPRGFSVGQNMLWSLAQFVKVWALVLVPMFFAAGVLQQFVSTEVIRALYG